MCPTGMPCCWSMRDACPFPTSSTSKDRHGANESRHNATLAAPLKTLLASLKMSTIPTIGNAKLTIRPTRMYSDSDSLSKKKQQS